MREIHARQLAEAPLTISSLVEKTAGRSVKVHVVTGTPAPEIVGLASSRDILVCGTHGRAGLERVVFGSVATKLMRSAPCPLLVVRPTE
jgi:nucleotide-binding universal stress UspA family protein